MSRTNKKKTKFLAGFSGVFSLNKESCNLGLRSKYNFSYFVDNQEHCTGLTDHQYANEILDIMVKLRDFSKKSLMELKSDSTLIIYKDFPSHSEFNRPKHIPHDVLWGRFRLSGKARLVGFVIPDEFHNQAYHANSQLYLCKNTFYIVFIDLEHKFYPVMRK